MNTNKKTTKDYILRDIDESFWRQIKSLAAIKGISIKNLIINGLKTQLNEETKK